MKPLKPKHFIKPTADDLELSEQTVDDIVSFYWSTLQKALSNLEGASVRVTNLGTFNIRERRIPRLKARYKKYLEGNEPESMTFNKHSAKKIAEFKLKRLEELEKELQEQKERKKEIKEKRKEYVSSKNLEK
jgi:nucleoid DNA-binding protein